MRIFYITSVLGNHGGSEIYARDLLKELQKRGHEIFVFTPEPYALEGAQTFRVPTAGSDALHKFEAPFFFAKAVSLAKKFKPDLVQSHSNSCMGFVGHMVKRKLGIPHVTLIELITSENYNLHTKLVYRMEKFLLPKLNYDKLVVWTDNMKEKYLIPWGISGDRIEVMPAALNVGNYPLGLRGNKFKERFGEHLITSIKTLWRTNVIGLKYIIKAMKEVGEKHPKYRYVVIGGGPKEGETRDYAKSLGLGNVIVPGDIKDRGKVLDAWAATEISPHSFVYEFSTSISLLEAMAMGKPCVVTDIGSAREFVQDSALVVEPYSEKAMAEGIIELIENPSLRKKLGRKARKLVEENYSIKKSVDMLERIYEETRKK